MVIEFSTPNIDQELINPRVLKISKYDLPQLAWILYYTFPCFKLMAGH